ncbi:MULTISPECIES: hypothetical protein [Streptomyces]|uniref:hypothetical protein n=1 Tax=Streptomyces TaxID=1883 RepID=UPI00123B0A6A|nr:MULTISPECIES: hypothetical protein [Streptomyces]NEA05668.1 hypothetical protein [Streptomyces sp. SID10116]MYY86561.1 hypothetical protein [Streptomyces sp. SID335]MYZ14272.1 hypothetical protein [Streptomyces sp. SID337]NDZ90376.1 hypothetical protein [Streptomyces sp. SID10115]NEB48028.1 hypothetical protein [Streptomyces sp. SID339]
MNNCNHKRSPTERGISVLFIVAALMLLGVAMGSVAHAPLPVSLVAAAVIGVWLAVFAVRERRARHR